MTCGKVAWNVPNRRPTTPIAASARETIASAATRWRPEVNGAAAVPTCAGCTRSGEKGRPLRSFPPVRSGCHRQLTAERQSGG